MDTRISVRALREAVENHAALDEPTTLALLEAVEAAHALQDKLHIIAADGKRRRNVHRLRDALARFDFGEQR